MDGKCICIQWPNWGPYHVARFDAVVDLFAQRGWIVQGVETSSTDISSLWGERPEYSDRIETLFTGHAFESLPPFAIRKRMIQYLERTSPDAVAINSYSLPDARAALEWCLDNDKRAVLMTDSRRMDAKRSNVKEWFKSKIVKGYDSAIVAGSQSRRYIAELGLPDEFLFTPYDVVDNQHFAAGQTDAHDDRWTRHKPYFVASTRDIPRKNLSGLLASYRVYRSEAMAPWNLVILGTTGGNHNDNPGVYFAGRLTYEELPEAYRNAQVFVHAALSDQWGLVINEAMASGLPILVSDRTGCVDELLAGGENGFVFDPTDAFDLKKKMLMISSSHVDKPAMGRKSREIIRRFTPESFAAGLFQAVDQPRMRKSGMSKKILRSIRVLTRKIDSFHSVER